MMNRARYKTYLMSDEWQIKKANVLERENFMCQGCGERRASEVYHTSYDHIYDEFLFELVALCSECHRRYHKVNQG